MRQGNQDYDSIVGQTVQAVDLYYSDDDLEGGEMVPTIELSESSEVYDLACSSEEVVEAPIAVPVGSLMSTGGIENEFNSRGHPSFRKRAEFISVAIIKPSKRTALGLSLSDLVDGGKGLCISGIKDNGFLKETGAPLEVGDRIVSINNHSCEDMDHKRAAKLLRDAPERVLLVARNVGGEPFLVESMITKPTPHARSGIGFASSESPTARLHISVLFPNGLFADSLLSEGDEVLTVNSIPCRELEPSVVADIVLASPKYVTVVAKKFEGNGVVVASDETTTRKIMRRSRPADSRDRCLVDPCIGCQMVAAVLLITAAITLIVLLLLPREPSTHRFSSSGPPTGCTVFKEDC
jgi:PDZ domain